MPQKFDPNFLAKIDKRFRPALMVTHHVNALTESLGGETELSHQQRLVVQRAAWAHQRLQELESAYAAGAALDTQEWSALTSTLFAALKLLGMKRQARPLRRLADILAEADE